MNKNKLNRVERTNEELKQRRAPEPLPVTELALTACPRCAERAKHAITNTYPNGNRRMVCAGCKMPFIAREKTHNLSAN